MEPELFLRKQFRTSLDSNKKMAAQSEGFKERMEDFCITLWKQTHHRGDDAVRAALDYAKRCMNKNLK